MFGRKGKLLKDGAQAEALVLENEMGGTTNSHGARRYALKLRVAFPDGTDGEVSCHAWAMSPAIALSVGKIVPVRYDPDDHAKVLVDEPAMDAVRQRAREAGRSLALETGAAELDRRRQT